MSGWPSGTSYSSWRPDTWSNSTICIVTVFQWNYDSSLPPGLKVKIGMNLLNFSLTKAAFVSSFVNA